MPECLEVSLNADVVDGSRLVLGVADMAGNVPTVSSLPVYRSSPFNLVTADASLQYPVPHSYNRRYGTQYSWGDYTYGTQRVSASFYVDTVNVYVSANMTVSSEVHSLRDGLQQPFFFAQNGVEINPYSGLSATGYSVSGKSTMNYVYWGQFSVVTLSTGAQTPLLSGQGKYISINVPNRYGDSDVSIRVSYSVDELSSLTVTLLSIRRLHRDRRWTTDWRDEHDQPRCHYFQGSGNLGIFLPAFS